MRFLHAPSVERGLLGLPVRVEPGGTFLVTFSVSLQFPCGGGGLTATAAGVCNAS